MHGFMGFQYLEDTQKFTAAKCSPPLVRLFVRSNSLTLADVAAARLWTSTQAAQRGDDRDGHLVK